MVTEQQKTVALLKMGKPVMKDTIVGSDAKPTMNDAISGANIPIFDIDDDTELGGAISSASAEEQAKLEKNGFRFTI